MRIRALGLGFTFNLLAAIGMTNAAPPGAAPLGIVAAENVYGDLAMQVGGDRVSVVSVLSNPAQDPHLFEPSPSTARAVASAAMVIYNGAGYDPWIDRLLSVTVDPHRVAIAADALVQAPQGANPHLWYDPAVMEALAKAIADRLAAADPAGAADYAARCTDFETALAPLRAKIVAMRGKYAGVAVTATEPVFDYMARAIGLEVRNPAFQLAVMNGTEPGARAVAAFEDDLKGRKVRALIYNMQATGTVSQRMQTMAEAAKVPVVGVSETEPSGLHYQDWMMAQLNALDAALSAGAIGATGSQ